MGSSVSLRLQSRFPQEAPLDGGEIRRRVGPGFVQLLDATPGAEIEGVQSTVVPAAIAAGRGQGKDQEDEEDQSNWIMSYAHARHRYVLRSLQSKPSMSKSSLWMP